MEITVHGGSSEGTDIGAIGNRKTEAVITRVEMVKVTMVVVDFPAIQCLREKAF